MAMRLEKDGGLIFIKGSPDPPVKVKWSNKRPHGLGLWVVLALLMVAVLWPSPIVAWWPSVAHTIKGLVIPAS